MHTRQLALAFALIGYGCGGSGGGGAHAGPADPDPNAPDATPVAPRLVIAEADGGVGIWDLTVPLTDRPPDATLAGLDGAPLAVAARAGRVIVISDGPDLPVAVFDDAVTLHDGSTPDHQLTTGEVGAGSLGAIHRAIADAAGNLWLLEGLGRILLIKGGATGVATGAAQFTHQWEQLASMTVAGSTLFAGQISGAGIVAWNDPVARSGPQPTPDWQLADLSGWGMTAGGDRLYALVSGTQTKLAAWNGAASLTATTAPDVELALSPGQAVGDLSWRDNALIAVVANGVNENRVEIFADSAAVTPSTVPDPVIAPDAADYLQRAYLAADGTLYVLDRDGLYVYRDALTSPTLVTKLTSFAQPVGFAVVD